MGKLVPRLEEIISNSAWLDAADFDTIHYVMRFGATAEDRIYCRRRPEYQELEVASQVQMSQLHEVFLNREKLRAFLCNELLRVFEHLARKYKLEPLPELTGMLNSYIFAQQSAPGDAPQAARPWASTLGTRMVEVQLGSETDEVLLQALARCVVGRGGTIREVQAGVGGSQEIVVFEIRLNGAILEAISETYMGLSLRGPADAVTSLAQEVVPNYSLKRTNQSLRD
ncbi:hypothetical protein HC024_21050 [Methylococcaceae bacterium WWC4]|nr:hypothetical protein [Methylococcaceae bacterium WWC4]